MIRCDKLQRKIFAMQDNLALVLEIDGNARADDRLDLAQPPTRFNPVAYDRAHLEKCVRHCRDLPEQSKRHHRKRQET